MKQNPTREDLDRGDVGCIKHWSPNMSHSDEESQRKSPVASSSTSHGLVVRIPGSHPGGPGSIPGNGNPFLTPPFHGSVLQSTVGENTGKKFPRRELNPDLLGESQIC